MKGAVPPFWLDLYWSLLPPAITHCQLTPPGNRAAHCLGLSCVTGHILQVWYEKAPSAPTCTGSGCCCTSPPSPWLDSPDCPVINIPFLNIYHGQPLSCWSAWPKLTPDELDGQIDAKTNPRQMAKRAHVSCSHMLSWYSYGLGVWLCVRAYVSRQQVCAYTHFHVCVQASISVYFCSPKPTHIRMQETGHIFLLLWAARQLSRNILEYTQIMQLTHIRINTHSNTHAHTHKNAYLPGVPHMPHLRSAKWNFLKAKKHFSRTN